MDNENNVVGNEVSNNLTGVRKKSNVLVIILGCLMVVFAGVAVFFGVKYFEVKNKDTGQSSQDAQSGGGVDGEQESREEIAAAVMAEEYKEVKDLMDSITVGIGNENWDHVKNGNGLTYKPEWLNTFILTKFDLEKRVVDQNQTDFNAAESNMNVLKTKLENAGFSALGVIPHLGSAGPEIFGYLNADKDITCSVYGDTDFGNGGAVSYYYVSLECAKMDWTWLTETEKNLIVELETAYHDKTGEYPTVMYSIGEVKNSQYEPYQTLQISLGGGRGLFYRTGPEAKWQFFMGTQAVLDCGDYDTDDLKKAYLGETCYNYDAQTNSTVQL